MNCLFVCNTSSDNITAINTEPFEKISDISLMGSYQEKAGPHGICRYKDKLLVANCYDNSMSLININDKCEEDNFYIGVHCNDLVVFYDKAYIVCGDSNNVIVFDLITKSLIEEIPCGSMPHNITINKCNNNIMIANMYSDSITIIDLNDNSNTKNIRVGSYPTSAAFVPSGEYAVICESNIGTDSPGCISIYSLKNSRIINRVRVGNSPVDICINNQKCYISNFGDGTISVIDINNYKEIKRINVGGMPRSIKYKDNSIFIGDSLNNSAIKLDLIKNTKCCISTGKEPTGMIIV